MIRGSPLSSRITWFGSREVDAGAVDGRRDGARQERAIVAGVIPARAGGIHGVIPEGLEELQGLQRLLATDGDPSRLVALGGAEAPEEGIRKIHRVAVGVTDRLADGMPRRLPLLALAPQLIPRPGPVRTAGRLQV